MTKWLILIALVVFGLFACKSNLSKVNEYHLKSAYQNQYEQIYLDCIKKSEVKSEESIKQCSDYAEKAVQPVYSKLRGNL